MFRALRAAVAREWRDQWRWTLGLGLGFSALVVMLSSTKGLGLTPLAMGAAILPTLACAALPASVVDDAASGLVRLVTTQPLSRGAYALLRIAGAASLALAVVFPIALALGAWEGDILAALRALPIFALACIWSAAAAILLGLLVKGSGAATALWLLLSFLNVQMALTVLAGVPIDDVLLRARHALPAGPAAESLMPAANPWTLGAPLVLALECALLCALAWWHCARGWRQAEGAGARARGALVGGLLLALLLPLLLPAATVVFP